MIAGATIDHLTLPLLHPLDLGALQYPVTMLWIVALMNSFNFIDGMDGLAAGIGTITASTFAILALSLNRGGAALLAAALAGACLGFLRLGFHPAASSWATLGTLTLGYLLAVIAVQGVLQFLAAVALVPDARPARADLRHLVRLLHRSSTAAGPGRPTPTTCITASCASASGRDARPSRSTPGPRCWPAVRCRALPAVAHAQPGEHRSDAHPGGARGRVLMATIWIVVVLEVVKQRHLQLSGSRATTTCRPTCR